MSTFIGDPTSYSAIYNTSLKRGSKSTNWFFEEVLHRKRSAVPWPPTIYEQIMRMTRAWPKFVGPFMFVIQILKINYLTNPSLILKAPTNVPWSVNVSKDEVHKNIYGG